MSINTKSSNMTGEAILLNILVTSTASETKGGESKLTKGIKMEKGGRGLPSATIAASQVT